MEVVCMLYTGSLKDINKEKYDEIWIIVRSLGNVKTGDNVYHVPQLSPSWELFKDFNNWKSHGLWNKKQFDTVYTPRFLKEMESSVSQEYINMLAVKCLTKDVLICCFCEDESMCHRSLVKSLVENSIYSKFYLLIAGSRTFNDYSYLKERCDYMLQNQNRKIVIVSGGAKGADSLAEQYAKEKGYELVVMPAEWDKYGKSAGFRRNEKMHQYIARFQKRGCICFWDGNSKGTQHNFDLCKTYDTPLRICRF